MFSEPLRGGRVGVCLFLAMAMLVLPGCGKVAVPDVVGMTLEAATSALTDVKLAVGTVTEVFNATVPAGQVVQQDPAAGTKIKSKSAVALVVSKGPEPAAMVAVPNVAGMTQAAAAAALSSAGLTLGTVTEVFSATVPAGQVISQNPAAGALVAPGSAVALVVSKGPEPVTTVAVPNVVGMMQAAAATALTGAGLTVGTVTESFSATVPAGQVISQNPAAGVSVTLGASVALDVSKGPEPPVPAPDIVGLTRAEAEAAISAAGLTVGFVAEAFSGTVPAGRVISQNPPAGTLTTLGTGVGFVVSRGPAIPVPDVAGMTESEAEAALSGAGLAVGTVTEAYSETVPAGQVISQNPAAGANAAAGSAVDFVVCLGSAPVNIPDANLAAAIREQLGLPADTPLTGEHMLALTYLNANSRNIADLTGLESAKNLAFLYFSGNTVTDLTPLAGLTSLISLGFHNNPVTDLTPLAGLVNMVELYLSLNQVTDVTPLSGMSALIVLDLGSNQITDVAPLSGLAHLSYLGLSGNQITTVASFVAGSIFTSANNPPNLALQSNPLLADVCDTQIPALETRGVTVTHDPCVPPVTVPDVTGMTLSESATALTDAGLTMAGVMESFSDTVPAGLVIRTNPAAGSLVSPGSAVQRVLSLGPATAVPDVVGMTQAAAETALTGAGLAVGTVTEDYSETVPAGGVISQNPAAGADVAAGSAVNFVVSLGSAPVNMPDANLAAAVRAELGLAGGTLLTRAHLLTLTSLSAGSAGVADLTGLEYAVNLASLSLDDNQVADAAPLADLAVLATLDLSTNEITTVEPLAAGTVFTGAASPVLSLQGNPLLTASCDTHIPALEARGVTVTHDACITPVAVPDLADMTQSGAETALTGAGLVLGAVTESFSNTVPAGQVISQNPAAGSLVAPGSAVDVVLSKGPSVFVPDVTLMLQVTAESALTGAGLAVGAVTQSNSDTVPAGQVISQNPAAGVEAAAGSAVDFVVSLGSAPVSVPDAALAAAIREQLGLAADTPLTGAHLLALTSLGGNNKGIADLTGLEHALNLTYLYLANDTVSDLTPLAGLTNLVVLGLHNNPITDLTPLAGLVNMGELYLQLNQVTDVTPLSGMTALLVLDLGANQIVDVAPLSGLTGLTGLYLFDNQIVDVTPLSGLTGLTILSLWTNQIVDVAPLSGLTGLVNLLLQDNKIADAAPLAALASLSFLSLDWNQLTTVAPLAAGTVFTEATSPPSLTLTANPLFPDVCGTQIPALEARGVTVTHDACIATATVPDVAGLARSTAMTAIGDAGLMVGAVTESASETVPAGRVISQNPAAGWVLAANAPVDIVVSLGPALVTMPDANLAAAVRTALGLAVDTPLTGAHLLALTDLSADGLTIADLTGLEHAANLGYLRLGNNQITSLAPLDGLTAISFLVIYENQITDLSPLAGMAAMDTLNIRANQISDLTPLAALVNMKEMMFNDNQITDVSALAGLTGPANLYVSSNPLSADACGTQIPALQAAGVTVTSDCL